MSHIAITRSGLRKTNYRYALFAFILGLSAGIFTSYQYAQKLMKPSPLEAAIQERIVHKGCLLPEEDGMITQFMRIKGKLECYRYQ